MPDGEVIDVPIVTEEQNQEPHEPEQAVNEAQQAVVDASQQQENLIPLNSPTLLLDESTTRFSGAEWFNEIQKKDIIVAGQGGIGSNLSFQLARMHPASMVLYDDDTVETVNMAGQLYARNDIGKSKVTAISDMITSYTNMQNIYAVKDKFTYSTEAGNIMMCGFDNMEARRIFFSKWHDHVMSIPAEERKNCLY
jgi:FlaA1/EpsC-like NDP-sugar epimerase